MIFNSFLFLWLFPLIFILYYGVTYTFTKSWSKIGNATLLIISYLLYINWKPAYALLLIGITAITFLAAKYIE